MRHINIKLEDKDYEKLKQIATVDLRSLRSTAIKAVIEYIKGREDASTK